MTGKNIKGDEMSLVWREQLSVGNAQIDADHQALIGIINEVEGALKAQSVPLLKQTLKKLHDYAHEHFQREEYIAETKGYANLRSLKTAHENLHTELHRIRKEVEALDGVWSEGVAEYYTNMLRHWLLDHVMQDDMKMKPIFTHKP